MGLRDLFRDRSPGEAATAVVLVSGTPRVDAMSLVQKQRARGRTVVRRDAPGSLALAIDDRQVLIKTLDQAYPEAELASFLRGTWWWPDAIDAARGHGGRVLVHVPVAAGDARDRHLLATSLVEDLLDDHAIAVLWSGTGAIVPPDRFVELARGASRTQLPITLWISVRFASVNGERIAFTTGMNAFGLPEIESEAGEGDPSPLATAIFEAVHDLLVSGEHPELTEATSKIHPKTRCLRL
ncbi:MAG: hypothetical protein ACXVEE_13615 [Polyangiales bacterium]